MKLFTRFQNSTLHHKNIERHTAKHFIHEYVFKNVVCEMRPFCPGGDELIMSQIYFCCTTVLMYHIPKWYIAFDRSRCSTKSPSFPCYCHRSKYIAANMLSYSKHRLRTYQPHCGPSNYRPICQSCVETDAKTGVSIYCWWNWDSWDVICYLYNVTHP